MTASDIPGRPTREQMIERLERMLSERASEVSARSAMAETLEGTSDADESAGAVIARRMTGRRHAQRSASERQDEARRHRRIADNASEDGDALAEAIAALKYSPLAAEGETPPLSHRLTKPGGKVGKDCAADCYACERAGLQERVKFTADYESLRERLSGETPPPAPLVEVVREWQAAWRGMEKGKAMDVDYMVPLVDRQNAADAALLAYNLDEPL